MDVLQKEKNELLKWIENIDDPKVLDDIRSVKEGIEKGRKDAREGRVTSHEEVRKSYDGWL